MTIHDLASLAQKMRAAQRLCRQPASYATMREAATAAALERALDAALEEVMRTPDVRDSHSVEEVPDDLGSK
jgi:hypothetical protein